MTVGGRKFDLPDPAHFCHGLPNPPHFRQGLPNAASGTARMSYDRADAFQAQQAADAFQAEQTQGG